MKEQLTTEQKLELSSRLNYWFLTCDVGESSEFMASVFFNYLEIGEKIKFSKSVPYDFGDIGRCIKLVRLIPEIKLCFPLIASQSKNWNFIIDNWDKLEEFYNQKNVTEIFMLLSFKS